MTLDDSSTGNRILVAIDIAKARNDVLVQLPDGKSRKFKMTNNASDYRDLAAYLNSLNGQCRIGFEATGNYHRPLAHFLLRQGFELRTISSLAVARTREALYNSWDKNDPKDAQVILHMLRSDMTQTYCDPLFEGYNDIQELSKTYYQVSLRKVRVQHSILTHFLPLYFPEAQRYYHCTRSEWFSRLLLSYPCPASINKYDREEFIEVAWDVAGRKVNKRMWLYDFFETACDSIAVPVEEDSVAINMFRTVLQEHIDLCCLRKKIESAAEKHLKDNDDFIRLRTIPGIGPILAMTILAEAGDLRRFSHHRKFLSFCGLNLSTVQSGRFRGASKLSKRGNARLRCAFWTAATVAIRMRENTFRTKYENYIKSDPKNKDLKRKAYTAVAAKMARVAYSMIKNDQDYRCFYEASVPSGKIPSHGPLRQH